MELKIEHLHLSFFGHEECLHDINLTFGEGVTVLYGESGSGKTALLKCLAAINAYTGNITLDGAPLAVGKDGDVQMVFDDLALFGRRSLYYNLTYPLRLRKVPKAQWADILLPHLKAWGLQKTFLDNPVYRVSQDVKVRVALARAGLYPRKVLLLDNPLRGLSPDDRHAIFWQLARFVREYQGIVLYATDSAEEVRTLGAKVAVLSGGYQMAHATVGELVATLPNTYVASRLVPFWHAEMGLAKGGAVHTDVGVLTARYPANYEGKRVLVGIDPADYRIATGDGDYVVRNTLWVEGKVYSVLVAGDRNVVVPGDYPVGATANVSVNSASTVFDPVGEWRIDAKDGE